MEEEEDRLPAGTYYHKYEDPNKLINRQPRNSGRCQNNLSQQRDREASPPMFWKVEQRTFADVLQTEKKYENTFPSLQTVSENKMEEKLIKTRKKKNGNSQNIQAAVSENSEKIQNIELMLMNQAGDFYSLCSELDATKKTLEVYKQGTKKLYEMIETMKEERKTQKEQVRQIQLELDSVKNELEILKTSSRAPDSAVQEEVRKALDCVICLDVPQPPLFVCPSCCKLLGCLSCLLHVRTCPNCRATLPARKQPLRGLDILECLLPPRTSLQ